MRGSSSSSVLIDAACCISKIVSSQKFTNASSFPSSPPSSCKGLRSYCNSSGCFDRRQTFPACCSWTSKKKVPTALTSAVTTTTTKFSVHPALLCGPKVECFHRYPLKLEIKAHASGVEAVVVVLRPGQRLAVGQGAGVQGVPKVLQQPC